MLVEIAINHSEWKVRKSADKNVDIFLRGEVFNGANLLSMDELAERLSLDRGDFTNEIQHSLETLSGFFSIIIRAQNRVTAIVDHVRSYPLFYSTSGEQIVVTDNLFNLRSSRSLSTDSLGVEEFLLTGYVVDSRTLFSSVSQIEAGQLVEWKTEGGNLQFDKTAYFSFSSITPVTDESTLRTQFVDVSNGAIDQAMRFCRGRQIGIPLSGGTDSRWIAALLQRNGVQNLVAYTYGRPNNTESTTSKRVAEQLGIPWYFVEYDREKWTTFWNSEWASEYNRSASGGTSLPVMQEIPALMELKSKGILAEGAVILPGHSGDFVAGSHLPSFVFGDRQISTDTITNHLFRKHYCLCPLEAVSQNHQDFWLEKLRGRISSTTLHSQRAAADILNEWNWRERQSKYIVNSVRDYEFFGFRWWLPLWEKAFVNFWKHVPLPLLNNRHWYNAVVKAECAAQIKDTELVSGNPVSGRRKKQIAQALRSNSPKFLRRIIRGRACLRAGLNHPLRLLDRYEPSEILALLKEGFYTNGVAAMQFLRRVKLAPKGRTLRDTSVEP